MYIQGVSNKISWKGTNFGIRIFRRKAENIDIKNLKYPNQNSREFVLLKNEFRDVSLSDTKFRAMFCVFANDFIIFRSDIDVYNDPTPSPFLSMSTLEKKRKTKRVNFQIHFSGR